MSGSLPVHLEPLVHRFERRRRRQATLAVAAGLTAAAASVACIALVPQAQLDDLLRGQQQALYGVLSSLSATLLGLIAAAALYLASLVFLGRAPEYIRRGGCRAAAIAFVIAFVGSAVGLCATVCGVVTDHDGPVSKPIVATYLSTLALALVASCWMVVRGAELLQMAGKPEWKLLVHADTDSDLNAA